MDGKYLTKAYKDRERKKYASYWPPSLSTRARDGVDAPRNPQHFLDAYFFLSKATQIESKLTSFQFELLNRTLRSPSKALKMRQIQSDICSICPNNVQANTSHAVADCAIPTFFIKFFNAFCKTNLKLRNYLLTGTNFEFSWPSPKLISKSSEFQIQHLFFAIKHFALNAHFDARFSRWSKLVYFAKILNITKTIADVRKFAKLNFDLPAAFLAFLNSNQYLIEE